MTDTESIISEAIAPRRRGAMHRFLRNPIGIASVVLLLVLIALGAFSALLTSQDPNVSSLSHINAPVGTPGYPLGADQSGRDILSRVLAAINVSVISAVIGTSTAVVVGTVFGLVSGYVGKTTDAATSWIFNLIMTFPAGVLVIVLYPVTGGSYQVMMLIFGFFLAPGVYRIVRNVVLGVRNELFVDAAKVSGISHARILARHVFPAVRGPLILSSVFLAGTAIGVQAGLAFLGLGSTLVPNFGTMSQEAFVNLRAFPLQFIWPSAGLALLTGGLVLLGNALRDALSPVPRAVRSTGPKRTKIVEAATRGPVEAASSALLSVENLRVSYDLPSGQPKVVVRGVSLTVSRGEIVGLVGESGSGKSQTAFSILGLLPSNAHVSADTLQFAGTNLLGLDERGYRSLRGRGIAYIPQEPMSNLDPSFTIGTQLVDGIRVATGESRREAGEKAQRLLARVGIHDPSGVMKKYPHEISGGMAQRVLIAGAVAAGPELLIADEPTTALDVTVQADILDLIRDLQAEFALGVLLVTHNFGVVADICDRVVVMRDGTVMETAGVDDIFDRPQDAYTQLLLDSMLDEETVRAPLVRTAAAKEKR